ncbi:glycosyltransferase [Alphaproteobacteria bacterium]|nr:glycosyltransferase [Alphaproteobacteria bacterium]MDC1120354.1 glycosyltransferase [Alphaproteobacteria bacterium]
MAFFIYDYSNTNVLHRKALLRAIDSVNAMGIEHEDITVVVSTRNMIRVLPQVIFRGMKTVINIVGFGRLYSDYGIFGRFVFNLIVWFHDRTTARAFIVEHDVDKILLERFVRRPVFTTHGSGFSTEGFTRKREPPGKILQIGYLSRFDKSKGSHEVLKAAQNLPSDRHLIIAGWDIKGERFSKKFRALAQARDNVTFLGKLHSRSEISQFFNALDLFLSPSVREGGNIALQEAIWHEVPFLTTDAPGCKVLADIFGCPALKMNEFSNAIVHFDAKNVEIETTKWDEKLEPFGSEYVEAEYKTILRNVRNLL